MQATTLINMPSTPLWFQLRFI